MSKPKAKRSYWTADHARSVIDTIERRGIPVKQFAEEQGIGIERLYRWKRRLAQRRAPRSSSPRFSEVTIRPSAPPTAIEIELGGGVHLRVTGDTRVDDVVAILSRIPIR